VAVRPDIRRVTTARLAVAARRLAGGGLPALRPRADRVAAALLPPRLEAEVAPRIVVDLDLRDLTQRHTWWQGRRYETPTVQVLEAWVQRGADRFFDMGANYGFYSWWLAATSPALEVHAFEPHPRLIAMIERVRARNGLSHVEVIPVALGDEATTSELHLGQVDSGHSTLGPHPELGHGAGEPVEVVTFDGWRASRGLPLPANPAWIAKLDVEGFELKVLRGMSEALAARAFAGLAVELNPYTLEFCGTSASEVDAEVRAHGYVGIEETADAGRWPTASTWNAFYVPS
jgi:FkbM family methyltransferase